METVVQDLRYAVRSLLRQPGFAVTAVLTLALGIGATTAIFSVVNAVVLRPLPFGDPDRLVAITNFWTRTGQRATTISAPDFFDWQEQTRSFEAMAFYSGGETSVTVAGSADYASVIATTPAFFTTMSVRPQLGRLLTAGEQVPGGPLAVVITDAYWRRQFNADPRAIGATVGYGQRIYTIVGVLQQGFRYPARADIYGPVWVRFGGTEQMRVLSRSAHNYVAVGLLRRGVTLQQANADMTGIARRLEEQYPQSNAAKTVIVLPLQELLVGDAKPTLFMLLAAVLVVLLIACANVANLLLARSTVRGREMVVRAAIGAGRGRLVRQLLTESAVLGLASAAAGAGLAWMGVSTLAALAPRDLPRLDEIGVDAWALGFALLVALASSVVFGLAPAIHVSRVQLVAGLRQGGKGSSVGARGAWARSAFVVAEIALAVVLVVGAGLLAKSLVALASVNLGFTPERLLVLRTAVPVTGPEEWPRAAAFYRDLLVDLRALPGVTAVGAVTSLPTLVRSNGGYWIEGGPGPEQTGVSAPQAIFNVVTPDYFRATRIPVKVGRDFNDGDRSEAPFVAIVNEALARQAFPGQDPIGRRIQCGLDTLEFMTIVGVVGDVKTRGPARPASAEIYMPFEQHPGPAAAMNIVARSDVADPLSLVETMRRKIRERRSDVPVRAETMEMTLETASATPRFRTFLLVVFAAVALLLAVAGVYGVMAYTVGQRVPEIGVRVALGATPGDILRLVVGQGAKLAAAGLVVGMGLALAVTRLLEGLLFGVTARDPMILASVAVVVTIAALGACYIPGRRALRVEPTVALRAE
jgi:putative ABC transport system permease protein